MNELEIAIQIALEAHAGQVDKGGQPYILHPLRVMMKLGDMKDKVAAVLHDVIEDSEFTAKDLLARGISQEVIDAVLGVTRQAGESYEEFVRRAKENPRSRLVKIADIDDNSDLSRIPNPTEKDFARVRKYKKALEILM